MILKRLAESFKNQNWFVVTVEILIVVIGIFIGLQVDDWNQSRKDDTQSQLFLEQLNLDIESDLLSIKDAIESHEMFIKHGKIALRFLDGENVFDKHQAEVEIAFERMHQVPKPQFLHGNLKSLMLGDAWAIITDQSILVKLMALTGKLGNRIDIYRSIEDNIEEVTALNRRVIGFSIPDDTDVSIGYDIDELKKLSDFKIAIQNAVVFHWYGKRTLNLIVSMLEQYKSEQPTKPYK
ncbi:MAG: hypothetical protein ACI9N9_002908 [Enterobacterales bacterium]|jgi:hypothetical protein